MIVVASGISCFAQLPAKKFEILERKDKRQIDILYNGKLLTSYCWYDSIRKPFLFPINTLDGITVTRGYPIKPLPGEPTDHPHHTGSWMSFESVNGLDFWNNSTAIPLEKRNQYGTILHEKLVSKKTEKDKASLTVSANWLGPGGDALLKEKTTYFFTITENQFLIDRISTLTATDKDVVFKDAKDGFFAIRVAKELQMPSVENKTFTDIHGNKTMVPISGKTKASGMYYSSNGLKGDSVWGTRAEWVVLNGKKDGKEISIGLFDHPENVGYPAYWHARGYGLFAINPLGAKIFSNGKDQLNFSLKPGTSVTFRYRMLIRSGNFASQAEMNKLAKEFGENYRK